VRAWEEIETERKERERDKEKDEEMSSVAGILM
jgi:hypothetical protein